MEKVKQEKRPPRIVQVSQGRMKVEGPGAGKDDLAEGALVAGSSTPPADLRPTGEHTDSGR